MLTRPSARASGAPGQVCTPCPNAMCWRAFGAVDDELVRVLEAARVAVRGAGEHHHRRAGRDVDAADGRRDARQPEVALDRALEPQRLLDEVRDARAVVAQELLEVGSLAEQLERGREEPHRRLLAGREQVRGDAHHVDDLRQ